MNSTQELLERLRAHWDGCSDYRIAKNLGVATPTVSNWKSAKRTMDDGPALRAAEILGDDPQRVVAELHQERAGSERERAFWGKVAAGSSGVLAAFVVATGLAGLPSPTQAGAEPAPSSMYYGKRRRWWRWIFPGAPLPA